MFCLYSPALFCFLPIVIIINLLETDLPKAKFSFLINTLMLSQK